jgi:hypothetical protein
MEKIVTDYDKEIQETKLKTLKNGLKKVLSQIDDALNNLSKEE